MKNQLTKTMVEHFNSILDKEGSCLRYVAKDIRDENIICYTLSCVDKYIGDEYVDIPNITKEFDKKARNFFAENYGVKDIGFSSNVTTLFAYKNLK